MTPVLAAAGRNIDDIAAITFVDIALVMVAARATGAAFRRIRQPAVVGEIVAGILLGPSLLGAVPGHLNNRIFPPDIVPYLNDLAQLGLIIFMFIVGLELDSNLMRGRARLAASVSLVELAARLAASRSIPLVLAPLADDPAPGHLDYLIACLERLHLPGFEVSRTDRPFRDVLAAEASGSGYGLAMAPLDRVGDDPEAWFGQLQRAPGVPLLLIRAGADEVHGAVEVRLRRLDDLRSN